MVHSDALVLFGATGDLARKKLFPAVYRLAESGSLDGVSVVGVAVSDWDDDRLRRFAEESVLAKHPGADREVLGRLLGSVSYVRGDYRSPEVYAALAERLVGAEKPLAYLAIPPELFPLVVDGLARVGLAGRVRLVVEKPFGRDRESAAALNRALADSFPEERVFRIDHYLGKEAVENLLVWRFGNVLLEPVWNRNYIDSVQVTMAEERGVGGRGSFYETVGCLRDVVQNHAMQVVALLTMEPPVATDADTLTDEKVKVLRAMRSLNPSEVVRGQYVGYRGKEGVDAESDVETFVALRLQIDNWRWAGVPVFVRAGKAMPRNVTECVVRFKEPATMLFAPQGEATACDMMVFRLGDGEDGVTLYLSAKAPGGDFATRCVRLDVSFEEVFGERRSAYERLLGDALVGDRRRFGRDDVVDEAWRVVQPVIDAPEPVRPYEPGTWGPVAADAMVSGHGGWLLP